MALKNKIPHLDAYLPALCDKVDLGNFRGRNVGEEEGFSGTIMIRNSLHVIFGWPGSSCELFLREIFSQLAYGSTLTRSEKHQETRLKMVKKKKKSGYPAKVAVGSTISVKLFKFSFFI